MFDDLKLFLGGEEAHQVSHWSNWVGIPLGSASGHFYKAFSDSPDQVRDLCERTGELALGILESVFFLGYAVFAFEAIIKCTITSSIQIEELANKTLNQVDELRPESQPEKKVDIGEPQKEKPPTESDKALVPQKEGQKPESDSEKKAIVIVQKEKPKQNIIDKKQPLAIMPIKKEKLLSSQELESVMEFFTEQFQDASLHRFFILVVNNHGHNEKSAKFVVDHYESYKKQRNPDFMLSDEEKNLFVSSLLKQMDQKVNKIENSSRVRKINEHLSLQIDLTVGDGSCAFHALLGTFKNGKWRCEDVKNKRQEFCTWLQNLHDQDQLPPSINTLLHDYFNHPQTAPASFKNLVKNKYEEHKGNPEAFIKDKEVFKCYLSHLVKVGTYLDQTELEAAALCFNKKVYLYQPGWFNDRDKVTCLERPFNEDSNGPEVCIWYNGYNHYEKAKSI